MKDLSVSSAYNYLVKRKEGERQWSMLLFPHGLFKHRLLGATIIPLPPHTNTFLSHTHDKLTVETSDIINHVTSAACANEGSRLGLVGFRARGPF